MNKREILEALKMPYVEFQNTLMAQAKQLWKIQGDNHLTVTGMLGFSNICRCQCLYCGMRAGCKIQRYRLDPSDVIASVNSAVRLGCKNIFLISGEDLGYGFDKLLHIVGEIKKLNVHLSLACGEFSASQYAELHAAGADEYAMKFEMSDRETFNRLNPSTNFDRRMAAIAAIKKSGMQLASGNIVDHPEASLEQIADDILLMQELGISWAPIIPYMPAAGTPLTLAGGRAGDIRLNLREISIVRLMLPKIHISAQQPGPDITKGLADDEGNLLALNAGADMLFVDMLPDAMSRNFSVVSNRAGMRIEHIRRMAELSGMKMV